MLLKKNILEKNRNNHPEVNPGESRRIIDAALYHSDELIHDKPTNKPNYWVLVKIDGKSSIVTIEIADRKDCHEIARWRFANPKALQSIKNRAGREGGQVLVTESGDAQGASGLHALTSDLDNNIPPSGEKSRVETDRNGEEKGPGRIEDFGEKIGGARKDLAEKTGPRPAKAQSDETSAGPKKKRKR